MKNILETLHAKGIAENTLLVWISDNGPMYGFYPNAGYSCLKGGKGHITEGGVRVPAMAYWPGIIEPNQDPIDILHVTDLYTTAASLAGAIQYIPNDRVTDGIDQTALLLLGEGHSNRNYIFHYSGKDLGAIRYYKYKIHVLKNAEGGLPPMKAYNIERDPGEKFGGMYPFLFTVTPVQMLLKGHYGLIKKYPNRKPGSLPDEASITAHD